MCTVNGGGVAGEAVDGVRDAVVTDVDVAAVVTVVRVAVVEVVPTDDVLVCRVLTDRRCPLLHALKTSRAMIAAAPA